MGETGQGAGGQKKEGLNPLYEESQSADWLL
jgi:hypothetical protein